MSGALLFLLPVCAGLWHMRRLCRLGRQWGHGELIARPLAADLGVHRPVEVLLHGAVSGPGSCGIFRPIIVLPMDAPTWHEDELTRAIIHELEHIRRSDWANQCLARAVCACYWFIRWSGSHGGSWFLKPNVPAMTQCSDVQRRPPTQISWYCSPSAYRTRRTGH